MKKVAATSIVFCAMFLVFLSIVPTVETSINDYRWIGATVRNSYDSFYGASITAYEEGTTASLVVNVYNDYSMANQVNVSAIRVGVDWGINYTSTDCSIDSPCEISLYKSKLFSITFTVPSTYIASNLVTHSYVIYVEHVNSTTGNKEIVDTWTMSGVGFAVFSSDQATAYLYRKEVEAYAPSYPYPSYLYIPIITARARESMIKAGVAAAIGDDEYMNGNFASATARYQNALELVQQAWSNETETWSSFENAFASLLRGGENFLTMQGYAWLIFGIGFLLISIGALVYLVRRPTAPKTD